MTNNVQDETLADADGERKTTANASVANNVPAKDSGPRLGNLQALVGIIDRPRSTLQAIGEQPRNRWLLPFILLLVGTICLSVVTMYRSGQGAPAGMPGPGVALSPLPGGTPQAMGQAGGPQGMEPGGADGQGQAGGPQGMEPGGADGQGQTGGPQGTGQPGGAGSQGQAGGPQGTGQPGGANSRRQTGGAEGQGLSSNPIVGQIIPPAMGVLTGLVSWGLLAGMLYLIGIVAGSQLEYGQLFAVVSWSWIPCILRDFFKSAYIFATGQLVNLPGLSFLVSTGNQTKDAANLLYQVLGQVDIFMLWHLLLIGLGIAVLNRFGRGKTLFVVLVYALIVIGIALIPSMIQPLLPTSGAGFPGGGGRIPGGGRMR